MARNNRIHPMLSNLPPSRMRRGKVVSAGEAVRAIQDGDTIATGGFVSIGVPEEILKRIETSYLETGKPRNLTLLYAAGQGDGRDRGLNHFGHEGLTRRIVGGHWRSAPKLSRLALENRCEAWNLPQGVITHLYRAIAGGKPGVIIFTDSTYTIAILKAVGAPGGVEGERFWQKLRGEDVQQRETNTSSISHSHVLAPDKRSHTRAQAVLSRLTQKAAMRLRDAEFVATDISIYLKLRGGEKAKADALAMVASLACNSFCWICFCVRVRWSHGFSKIPAKD